MSSDVDQPGGSGVRGSEHMGRRTIKIAFGSVSGKRVEGGGPSVLERLFQLAVDDVPGAEEKQSLSRGFRKRDHVSAVDDVVIYLLGYAVSRRDVPEMDFVTEYHVHTSRPNGHMFAFAPIGRDGDHLAGRQVDLLDAFIHGASCEPEPIQNPSRKAGEVMVYDAGVPGRQFVEEDLGRRSSGHYDPAVRYDDLSVSHPEGSERSLRDSLAGNENVGPNEGDQAVLLARAVPDLRGEFGPRLFGVDGKERRDDDSEDEEVLQDRVHCSLLRDGAHLRPRKVVLKICCCENRPCRSLYI